jgi:hypothetical protein
MAHTMTTVEYHGGDDTIVVPAAATPFRRIASAIDSLGFIRDPDRTDVATAVPGEPSFASWSQPDPDDGEIDYHFDPDHDARWLLVRGEKAAVHAGDLATALGGRIAGTTLEHLAALLTRSRAAGHRPTRSGADRWQNMRMLVAARSETAPMLLAALLLAGLDDPDWRVRMTAMVGAARLGLRSLAHRIAATEVPPSGEDIGLEAEDRRALLAMRQAAADLLRGTSQTAPRPEDAIAAMRHAYQLHLRELLEGRPAPPDRAALLLTALLTPEALASPGSFPAWWENWLA